MMGSGRVGWLVLVGLTSPHSWQAQSSHLWRPTSVILTVRPPLNWTLAALQAKIQPSLRLRCFWHSGVDSSGNQMEATYSYYKCTAQEVEAYLPPVPTLSSPITSQRYSILIMFRPFCPTSPVYAFNSFHPIRLSSHFCPHSLPLLCVIMETSCAF